MKTWMTLLVFLTVNTQAQIRLIGTNALVDLTPAAISGPVGSYSNCWLVGKVFFAEGKVAYVETYTGEMRYIYSPPAYKKYGDVGDSLSMIASTQLAGSNGISAGHFFSLSPLMKENFRRARIKEIVMVINPPLPAVIDAPFRECGVSVGNRSVLQRGVLRAFDCGVNVTNLNTTNYHCYTATPNGLIKAKRFEILNTP